MVVPQWDRNVPRISCEELSLSRFYNEFMIPNMPVIITGLVERWKVRSWILPNGEIDTKKIKQQFGDSQVTVHNCANEIKDMGRLETREMTVREYLEWWENRPKASSTQSTSDLLYLKDWNFCKEHPEYVQPLSATDCKSYIEGDPRTVQPQTQQFARKP